MGGITDRMVAIYMSIPPNGSVTFVDGSEVEEGDWVYLAPALPGMLYIDISTSSSSLVCSTPYHISPDSNQKLSQNKAFPQSNVKNTISIPLPPKLACQRVNTVRRQSS